MGATSGREIETASTQPSRFDASSSASGPHSVGSPAVIREATRSAMSAGTVASTAAFGAPDTWISKLIGSTPQHPPGQP